MTLRATVVIMAPKRCRVVSRSFESQHARAKKQFCSSKTYLRLPPAERAQWLAAKLKAWENARIVKAKTEDSSDEEQEALPIRRSSRQARCPAREHEDFASDCMSRGDMAHYLQRLEAKLHRAMKKEEETEERLMIERRSREDEESWDEEMERQEHAAEDEEALPRDRDEPRYLKETKKFAKEWDEDWVDEGEDISKQSSHHSIVLQLATPEFCLRQ